ncbi:hypothetical protein D9M72_352150 [compost metagenome]
MRLLELAHVDGDEVLLAAIHGFGQCQCRFCLAHTRRAGQQEYTHRLVRIRQPRPRRLHALRDGRERWPLADHARFQS